MEFEDFDPKNINFGEDETKRPVSNIHIRLQQRNGKKTLTLVEGLSPELDLKALVRSFKKGFHTNGAILQPDPDEKKYVIQLNGDMREKVKNSLVENNIWQEGDPPIKIHGF